MVFEKMIDLSSPNNQTKVVRHWGEAPSFNEESDKIPIFHVNSMGELNRIVGYARFKYSTIGTVLYRGQLQDYGKMLPSGLRKGKNAVSEATIDKVINDPALNKFFGFNDRDVSNDLALERVIVESVLQHYGGNTYCIDLVDNHWSALWFGVYKFAKNHYFSRMDNNSNLYIYLFLADTKCKEVNGVYVGDETYTIDLRKAVPSTFQRPSSQHGWIMRSKIECQDEHFFDKYIVGIIEVNVREAKRWLGKGTLLSQTNFFPAFDIDLGYDVLLQRQAHSGRHSSLVRILPKNTICNYHLSMTFYQSDRSINVKPIKKVKTGKKTIKSLTDLYVLLLNKGWKPNTVFNGWDQENPWHNQSASTSLLVQSIFGGEIIERHFGKGEYYFNRINGVIVDLTYQDKSKEQAVFYTSAKCHNKKRQKILLYYQTPFEQLIKNCNIKELSQ